MARYLCNDRFFNDRLFYEGEVYDLEPSEVKRITASRQMHHLRALQPELAESSEPEAPLDDLAKRLKDLSPEDRDRLADKLRPEEEKTAGDAPPAPSGEEQVGKPMTRAELVELAEKKGIKTDGMTKAQILEKLAQAAPGA
jgi:hypothetical protein